MFVKNINLVFNLTPSKLLNIYDGFVNVMYDDKEREKYEKFFELGRKQIENMEEVNLTTRLFLKDYPLENCEEIGVRKLKEIVREVTLLN